MNLNSDVALPSLSSFLGLEGSFRKGLLFLIHFAWASRIRLPILMMVGFMAFDIRMQLEINIDVEMRHIHYPGDSDSSSESSSEDSGASSDIFSDAEDDEESVTNRPI